MYFALGRMPGDRQQSSAGYTLIEVLVAAAVFSAMVILAGMALNQSLRQYHGLVDRGLNFWSHAQKIWTDKSFNSIVDYYTYDARRGWFPYFIGNQEGVSYVSLSPLAGDWPVVVWIRKELKPDGKYDLVYYELPVYAKSYLEISGDLASGASKKGKSIKLLESADRIDMTFFGYDVRDEKHRWREIYDSSLTKRLPLLVQIVSRHGDSERKLMYGIHVNSNLKMGYGRHYDDR